MTARLLTWMLVALLAGAVAAEDDAGREELFSLGTGARGLGMGGTFTGFADDASTVYYNPAGLARLDFHEISLLHTTLFEGTLYNSAVWAYPISRNDGIGFAFMRVGTDDIVKRVDGATVGEFGYSTSQAMFSYGRRLTNGIAVGLSFKAVNQSLDNLSDWAIGADVGVAFDMHRHLSIGFITRNFIRPGPKLEAAAEEIPRAYVGGMALHDVTVVGDVAVSAGIDLEKYADRDMKIHGGGEVVVSDRYALRAGYDRDNLSFGAGLRAGPIKIDYAYKLMDYVDDSHRFSLTFLLGAPSAERFAEKPLPLPPPPPTEKELKLMALREKASEFFHVLELDSALHYYREMLVVDPENREIARTIASIEQELKNKEQQARQLQMAEKEIEQFAQRYLAQARSFKEKKYYAAAEDMVQLVLDIDPENAEALAMRREIRDIVRNEVAAKMSEARAAERDGRTVDAINAYNRVLELQPGNAEAVAARQQAQSGLDAAAQLQLGVDLFQRGRYQQARQRFRSVLRSDSTNTVAQDYLNRIATALSKPSTLEDLQANPDIWPLYLEGIRHMRNQEYQKAIDAWEKVLEVFPNNEDTKNNIEQARLRLKSQRTE
ncbi:MAG: PorV/PorQ family protein [candidate division Zixibacteria bacterium]|jgi:tetratricopeptide (TPR) repeat protein|nr:PorV/PorQ family protein [candidate division Zixibacteria bacterium]